jgi:hypothetical protein
MQMSSFVICRLAMSIDKDHRKADPGPKKYIGLRVMVENR